MVGNSPEVLAQPAKVDGKNGTIGELQIARARKVALSLIKLGIDNKKINRI